MFFRIYRGTLEKDFFKIDSKKVGGIVFTRGTRTRASLVSSFSKDVSTSGVERAYSIC